MAKVIVAIEIPDIEPEDIFDNDWFPRQDDGKIAIDEAFLTRSLEDDSFFAFEFLEVRE